MNQLNIKFRTDTLSNWLIAESSGQGKLAKGEVGIAIVETTDGVVEAIARIGIGSSPVVFSSCPIVFRSPFNFTQETSQIVKIDETPSVDSFITYQFDSDENGKFSSKSFEDVVCDFQIPENVVTFDTAGVTQSGFLRWIVEGGSTEGGSWQLDTTTVSVELPESIYGGNAESF
jgi:hypothetical protein